MSGEAPGRPAQRILTLTVLHVAFIVSAVFSGVFFFVTSTSFPKMTATAIRPMAFTAVAISVITSLLARASFSAKLRSQGRGHPDASADADAVAAIGSQILRIAYLEGSALYGFLVLSMLVVGNTGRADPLPILLALVPVSVFVVGMALTWPTRFRIVAWQAVIDQARRDAA